MIFSESDNRQAQVVVGAFGLDEGSTRIMSRSAPYREPQYLTTVVTKIHPPAGTMAGFGSRIHAFLPSIPRIEFGAVTPKGNHLAVNIAGARVDVPAMEQFLSRAAVRATLSFSGVTGGPGSAPLYFKGRFPISIAGGFYGDRYVIVGDAAGLVRSFKGKGINLACLSGLWAAQTILAHGVSHAAFADNFARACNEILSDLSYGRDVRYLVAAGRRLGLLDRAISIAEAEPAFRAALLDAVAGNLPYRAIVRSLCRPGILARICAGMFRLADKPERSAVTH